MEVWCKILQVVEPAKLMWFHCLCNTQLKQVPGCAGLWQYHTVTQNKLLWWWFHRGPGTHTCVKTQRRTPVRRAGRSASRGTGVRAPAHGTGCNLEQTNPGYTCPRSSCPYLCDVMRSGRSHLLRSKKGLERLEGALDHEVSLALFFVFRCSGTLLRSVGSVVLCLGVGQLATRQG